MSKKAAGAKGWAGSLSGLCRRLALTENIVTGADRVYRLEKRLKRSGGSLMCQLFAHQPQRDYESQTRSLRIDGHCTSIRLEMAFWDTLEEIASKEDMSLAKFLTRLHSEVLDHCGEVHNFASLLRCSCLIYRSRAIAVVPDFLEGAAPRLVAAE
jgi:predicted DNA-binding ribbon-helix-helix protein